MQVLPDVADDETPVFSLPKNETANTSLRKWLKDAGITDRPITFHSARHSAATLLLSNNVPLAVVSKQLGHLKSSTTEIYAKIVDEAQKVASSKMDDLFTVKND
jgi:integrase